MAESLWKRLGPTPLQVDDYELERLEQPVTRGFTRVTTVSTCTAAARRASARTSPGIAEHHDRSRRPAPSCRSPAAWTLESFSDALEMPDPHRRWAYESAALDLALRQGDTTLAEAVGREPSPGDASSSRPGSATRRRAAVVLRWLELEPSHRFKLDPGDDWTDELIPALAETGAVVTADYKAYYRTENDPPPDPELYRRVAEGFPDAYLEDPALTDETDAVLEPHRERVTWDAPIHSVADVEALAFPPRVLNSKPSRFGRLRSCSPSTTTATRNGISLYGGGMFELGPGRGQIQYLASLFHPDGPNDVAPRAYNDPEPRPGLPPSPLPPAPEDVGFRWREPGATL